MKIYKRNCKHCGKQFEVTRNNRLRKYCSPECREAAVKNQQKQKNHLGNNQPSKRVKVTCAICGKVEEVCPSRAKNYKCCSVECLSKYNHSRYSNKVPATCEVCGKIVMVKPSRLKRQNHFTCSRECSKKLRRITYLGENNPQFGLKGLKNDSFRNEDLTRKNGNLTEILVYKEEMEQRITKHRDIVMTNKDKFDPVFFESEKNLLRPGAQVHHKNINHDDNRLENLTILSRAEHSSLHHLIKNTTLELTSSIIGVLKQYNLLETDMLSCPNQQSDDIKISDSETMNIDNSQEVLTKVVELVTNSIVQIEKLTDQAYQKSIEEFNKLYNNTTNESGEEVS